MQRFKNKFALITGGTNGMGFATAQQFIKEDGKVIITGRRAETVNKAVERLGKKAFGIVSNAGSMKDIMLLHEQVKQHTENIDLLFVNAGYGKFAPVEFADETHFDELFNMLVKGTFFTVQQTLPLMKKGSAVVFNTSLLKMLVLICPGLMPFTRIPFSVNSAAKVLINDCTADFAAE